MINSFLVTLHNDATQPTNPSSTVGDVLWPNPYKVKVYTGSADLANQILFDRETNALKHFLTAIQLLWVVQESVCADTILVDDPRVSYTQEQLLGQFESVTRDDQQISRILQRFGDIQALDFLEGDLLEVYRSSLSRMDKLAAVISYFGQRNG
jgi:hypothetical protein